MRRSNPNPMLWLGALAFALALAETATGQVSLGPRVAAGVPEVRLVERNAEKLELDEKTIAAVQALAAEAKERDTSLLEEIKEQRLKVRDLLDQPLPDKAELLKQSEALSVLTAKAQGYQLDTTLKLRALLSPEQREKFMEIRKTTRPARRPRRPN